MSSLQNKEIILGITGSIAAYKTPDLVRLLSKARAKVTCVLTENGSKFVTPLTLQTVSQNTVYQGMFDMVKWDIEHISLAQKADVIVIAPATADCIARLANGNANDLLSCVVLATKAPVLICPAMNDGMWKHAATQNNLKTLHSYGYSFTHPEEGQLACGTTGTGRLASLETIITTIQSLLTTS